MYLLKNPRLHVSGSMTSITTVSAVEKLKPSQRLRAHLQHICRGPVRKILPWGPWMTLRWSYRASSSSVVLPHPRARRKEQSSNYFAVSLLQRWITSGGKENQTCRKVHQKVGKYNNQQCFSKCNTLRLNFHSCILRGLSWTIPSRLGAMSIPSQVSKQDTQSRTCLLHT